MRTRLLLVAVTFAGLATAASGQAPGTVPYDHIHLAVPDPDKAYDWYVANLGGQVGENPGRVIFERFENRRPLPVQMIFIRAAGAPPSEGGVIDRIGFSVPDAVAKAQALEKAGAHIVVSERIVPGLWKQALVTDPWGVSIELVEDPAHLGFHHIGLRSKDPDATMQWFAKTFGGKHVVLAGRLEVLQYGTTYLMVDKGDGAPSQGRAIDHLGFAPPNMNASEATWKAGGVTFTSEPAAQPNQFGHRTAYVEAPGGVRIELVEHTQCAWGRVPE
jgi:catechol 2,3-dioxygenase-like lactoylglutathione lyase family enzyme